MPQPNFQACARPRLFVEGAKTANEHAGRCSEIARHHAEGEDWARAGRAYRAALTAADMAAHIERDIIRALGAEKP